MTERALGLTHEIEEISAGVRSIQVHDFSSIHDASAANSENRIRQPVREGFGKFNGVLDGVVFWLDAGLVVDVVLDSGPLEGGDGVGHWGKLGYGGVGDDQDTFGVHVGEIHADFVGGPRAEADA